MLPNRLQYRMVMKAIKDAGYPKPKGTSVNYGLAYISTWDVLPGEADQLESIVNAFKKEHEECDKILLSRRKWGALSVRMVLRTSLKGTTHPIKKEVREWNNGEIVKIATRILLKNEFESMPILADMLEEAGCTEPNILYTLRVSPPAQRRNSDGTITRWFKVQHIWCFHHILQVNVPPFNRRKDYKLFLYGYSADRSIGTKEECDAFWERDYKQNPDAEQRIVEELNDYNAAHDDE